ncbi:hypothetical protein ECDEC10F_3189 [Escherichia coli DEC10F]|nr:hypothetical protein ECDEC10F_3189 [Escherichia coli DEC10F]
MPSIYKRTLWDYLDRAHLQMILWLISGNMKNSMEDESAGVAGVV